MLEWAGTSYTQGHFQLTTAAAAKESSGPCFTIESTLQREGGRVLTPSRPERPDLKSHTSTTESAIIISHKVSSRSPNIQRAWAVASESTPNKRYKFSIHRQKGRPPKYKLLHAPMSCLSKLWAILYFWMRVWTKNHVGSFNVFPFLVDFSLAWLVTNQRERKRKGAGGGLMPGGVGSLARSSRSRSRRSRTPVVGRKDGRDPRSAAPNTAVNLVFHLF